MAWNEPGNQGQDPWGQKKPSRQGGPDIDQALRDMQERFGRLFGGGSSGAVVFVVLIALAWGLMGFYQVNEQERAVVLRFGVYKETVQPGLHWNPPIVDSVSKVNVTRLRSHSSRALMLTRNVNLVQVELSVQYNIDDAKKFVLAVRDPERSLQQAAESALRHVVGNTLLDQVLTEGRANVAIEVQQRLQSYLDGYNTGIRINKVNIGNASAPGPVQDAFNDVNKAREDEERFKNEAQAYANMVVPESRGKAQRMLEEAAGYKEQVVARAQGDASRFTQLLTEYRKAPGVTRERLYVDAMQEVMSKNPKVLVDHKNGNSLMYLPLDKLGAANTVLPAQGNRMDADQLQQLSDRVLEKVRGQSQSTRGEERR
ncbi:MAG TPA: FtsH protease activity modulator HflK [Pseudomonadales bacterium]|jgi:membrane protease subunit HflK